MSGIRRSHPGYFQVTLGLAGPWYIGLGVAFLVSINTRAASSQVYTLVTQYVPLAAWGVAYLTLGVTLLIAVLVPGVPHALVRGCCLTGLILTTTWLVLFLTLLIVGKMDLISVIPAWTLVAAVEWAAFREPETGPDEGVLLDALYDRIAALEKEALGRDH